MESIRTFNPLENEEMNTLEASPRADTFLTRALLQQEAQRRRGGPAAPLRAPFCVGWAVCPGGGSSKQLPQSVLGASRNFQ